MPEVYPTIVPSVNTKETGLYLIWQYPVDLIIADAQIARCRLGRAMDRLVFHDWFGTPWGMPEGIDCKRHQKAPEDPDASANGSRDHYTNLGFRACQVFAPLNI